MGTDGSRADIGPIEIVFLALTLLMAGIHLSLALLDPAATGNRSGQFLLIGAAFLAGFVARLTPYWRPVLYLLGAGFAFYLGVLWLLGGTDQLLFGIATGIVSTAFFLLALYLFIREESAATRV